MRRPVSCSLPETLYICVHVKIYCIFSLDCSFALCYCTLHTVQQVDFFNLTIELGCLSHLYLESFLILCLINLTIEHYEALSCFCYYNNARVKSFVQTLFHTYVTIELK